MLHIAVTTYPPWGWDVYARHCIESWVKFWPGSILAYYEGNAPPTLAGVESRPLDSIVERQRFLNRNIPEGRGFLHDAKRFCHKVYAQLDAISNYEKFWWVDSDLEMKQEIPEDILDQIIDESFVSFLGRDSYTETGLIAFNQTYPEFRNFKRRYRECYDEGKLLSFNYWTDCHAFDYARQGGGHDLTPEGRGFENVLRNSPLGDYMEHHKGKLKLELEEQ